MILDKVKPCIATPGPFRGRGDVLGGKRSLRNMTTMKTNLNTLLPGRTGEGGHGYYASRCHGVASIFYGVLL